MKLKVWWSFCGDPPGRDPIMTLSKKHEPTKIHIFTLTYIVLLSYLGKDKRPIQNSKWFKILYIRYEYAMTKRPRRQKKVAGFKPSLPKARTTCSAKARYAQKIITDMNFSGDENRGQRQIANWKRHTMSSKLAKVRDRTTLG